MPMVPMVGRCFICGYLCNPRLINCALPGLDDVAVFCSHSCLNRGRDLYGYRQPTVAEAKTDDNNANYINNVYNDNFNDHVANDNKGKKGCLECERRSKRVLVDFGVQVDLVSHYESDLDDHVMVSPVNVINGEYAANMESASSPDFYEAEDKGAYNAVMDNGYKRADFESKCNGSRVGSSAMLSQAASNLAPDVRVEKGFEALNSGGANFVGGVDENLVMVEKAGVKHATVEHITIDDKRSKNGVVMDRSNSGNKNIVNEEPINTVDKNFVAEKCPNTDNALDKVNKNANIDEQRDPANKGNSDIHKGKKNVVFIDKRKNKDTAIESGNALDECNKNNAVTDKDNKGVKNATVSNIGGSAVVTETKVNNTMTESFEKSKEIVVIESESKTKLQNKREIRRAKKQIRKQQKQLYAQSRQGNVISPSTTTSNDTSGLVTPMDEDNCGATATNENSGNASPMNGSNNEQDMPNKNLSPLSLEDRQLEDRRLTKRQQKIEHRRLLAANQKREKAAKRLEMQIKTAYEEAEQLLRDGKAVQAAIRINYALKDHGDHPELYSLRSDCYCAIEKVERAVEDAGMAVQLKQSDENLVKLFEMQLRGNLRNEALETCEMIEDKLLKAATKEKASH